MPCRLVLPLAALPLLQMPAKIETCRPGPLLPEAFVVVQLTGQWVDGPDDQGVCTLTGPVARSFQGPLPLEALVQVTFPCGPAATGGSGAWNAGHDPREVADAGAVEVHATIEAAVAYGGRGLLLLEAPTEAPVRHAEGRASGAGEC